MWWVDEEPWLPVLFVLPTGFFWMYVKREKWSGPFATDLLNPTDRSSLSHLLEAFKDFPTPEYSGKL